VELLKITLRNYHYTYLRYHICWGQFSPLATFDANHRNHCHHNNKENDCQNNENISDMGVIYKSSSERGEKKLRKEEENKINFNSSLNF
jgi:hypothetical protein